MCGYLRNQRHLPEEPYLREQIFCNLTAQLSTMPSRPYPIGEFIRNIFSVIIGVLVFFGLLFAILPLFGDIYERLYSSDSVKSARLVSGAYLGIFLLIVLICGLVTGLIATRKKVLHAFIAGCVLVVLYAFSVGKDVNWKSVQASPEYLAINIAIPLALLIVPAIGGWISLAFRRKKIYPMNNQ